MGYRDRTLSVEERLSRLRVEIDEIERAMTPLRWALVPTKSRGAVDDLRAESYRARSEVL